MALEDFEIINKYRPAMLALKYFEEKNEVAAAGALEKLTETADFGEDGGVLVDAVKEISEGNKLFANSYAKEYQERLHNMPVKDLFDFYNPEFKEYLDEAHYGVAKKIFAGYDKKYGDILDEVIGAQETLNSKRPNLSEDEKKKAQGVIDKYKAITLPLQSFEQMRIEKLAGPIDENALKETLAELYKPEEAA